MAPKYPKQLWCAAFFDNSDGWVVSDFYDTEAEAKSWGGEHGEYILYKATPLKRVVKTFIEDSIYE